MSRSTIRSPCFIVIIFSLIAVFCSITLRQETQSLLMCMPNKLFTNDSQLQFASGLPSSYKKASMESFGFFDDINDVMWQRHQQRARTESLYAQPSNPNIDSENEALWLLNNVDPIFTCPNLRRVGGRGDGPKWACDPHRLVLKQDCLIYSIGSRGVYRFEDGIIDLLKESHPMANVDQREKAISWLPNCEIHVFDPDPKYVRVGDAENKNIHYHAIGLKSSYEPFDAGKFPNSSEFLSFQDIQKQLGHENRRLDIFKIDCEGCEWSTYQDWLHPDVDIRQILIETHGLRQQPNRFFDRFLDMGFVPFSKEANTHPWARPVGTLFEWGFVKLHPNFLKENLKNI